MPPATRPRVLLVTPGRFGHLALLSGGNRTDLPGGKVDQHGDVVLARRRQLGRRFNGSLSHRILHTKSSALSPGLQ